MRSIDVFLIRYRTLVVVQVVLLILGLTLSDILFLSVGKRIYTILIPIFLFLGAIYLALLYKVIQVHPVSDRLKKFCLLALFIILIASILAENPLIRIFEGSPRTYVLFGIHFVILLIELFVIVLTLRLVLLESSVSMTTRLWATCAVYFLMAIAFASVYDLMNIVRPNSFGEILIPGFKSYAESMYFSLNSMVKLQSKYKEVTYYAKSVSIIQAVWNDLFVALLVGNILAKKK